MKRLGLGATIVATLALSACAGDLFPKNFDPNRGQSLLAYADKPNDDMQIYYFRLIDKATGEFPGTSYDAMHYPGSYWQLKKSRPDLVFSVMPAFGDEKRARDYPPGDYAFVGIETMSSSLGGYGIRGWSDSKTKTSFRCFQDGAPTFTMHAGEIEVVPVGPVPVTGEQLGAEFAKVRAEYPEIQGQARVAEMTPLITFGDSPLDRSDCLGASRFTVKR
jgi:hypothetical protein